MTTERPNVPELAWNPHLGNVSISMEVRDISTDNVVLQRDSVRRGKLFADESENLPPGIYKAIYRTRTDSASELFTIGNLHDLFAQLREKLSQCKLDPDTQLDIEAQLRRARILLADKNYSSYDMQFQEKITHTLGALADIGRRLGEGAAPMNISSQPGIHIRGFKSATDGSFQFYKLFVPTTYNPESPIPLLVIGPTRIGQRKRPFIEGPVMANHRQALLWSKIAETRGYGLLWPGYKSVPEGYFYESAHLLETIQAVGNRIAIDNTRISLYATCSAGFSAGRLVTEYPNFFAAIVYDRAVYDLSLEKIKSSPSLMEWYSSINPSRHVINNPNIKIFVMHDDTKPEGHGPMELTTKFLEQATATRDDIVSHISKQPMTQASRLDTVFSWLADCRNENPDGRRSYFSSKAGYTGPIMEIFATPLIIVEGTRASGADLQAIQIVVESVRLDYMKHFHGAECAVKKDTEVTRDDINNHSLILVGNPQSNTIWEKLQPQLPLKMTSTEVLYENNRLTGARPFQVIARHPHADGKYVLMIGAGDLRTLGQVTTDELFNAWYDCILFSPRKIISKLDSLHKTKDTK